MSEIPNVILRLNYYPKDSKSVKFANRREFYSGSIPDDYMRYIDKGTTESDFMEYAGNPEKSSGVFDKNGLLSKPQKSQLRKALRETDSVIWDMVISLEETYGTKHLSGYNNAIDLLKAQLNKFFKQGGLNPDNVIWYAGLHENTDNRHIHVSFFEKEPQFYRQKDKTLHYHHGKLRQAGIDNFKISIEQYFSSSAVKLKNARKNMLAAMDNTMASFKKGVHYDKELRPRMSEIMAALPIEGRLGYNSENMYEVRPLIDSLTAYMFKNHKSLNLRYSIFRDCLLERDKEIIQICKRQNIADAKAHLITDTTITDLYRRLGNKVIGLAFELRQSVKKEPKVKGIAVRKRYKNKSLGNAINYGLKLNIIYEEECQKVFNEYFKKLQEYEFENEMDR